MTNVKSLHKEKLHALSHAVNPLQDQDLSVTISAMTLNDRARQRLAEEKARRKLSERELAQLLNWSQSKIAQKFSGRTPITLDELDGLCFALGLTPTEAVRDRGVEFCAEMTPTELRLLEQIRELGPDMLPLLYRLLGGQPGRSRVENRGITKPSNRLKKAR